MSLRNRESTYFSTLCSASAILATKITVVHLLVVRSRLMADDPALPHDGQGVLNPLLKKVLLCFGSDFGGKQFVSIGERLEKNCAENEPFFVLTAILTGLTASVPADIGTALVTTYTASRCIHSAVFLLGEKVNTSFRSVPYIISFSCALALSALGLKGCNEVQSK